MPTPREAAEGALRDAAAKLTAKRTEAAGRLGRAVGKLLPQLGLPGGKLEVAMEPGGVEQLERIIGAICAGSYLL